MSAHTGGGEGSAIDADLEMLWDRDYTVVVLGNLDTPAARFIGQSIVRVLMPRRGP